MSDDTTKIPVDTDVELEDDVLDDASGGVSPSNDTDGTYSYDPQAYFQVLAPPPSR